MPKKLVKEYDFEFSGRIVRVAIFKGMLGFWGYWDCEDQRASTEAWYQSITDATYMIEQHARRTLQTKETPQR